MTPADTIAVEFALNKYHATKSDATIATELFVPVEEVAALRLSLGLTTPHSSPKSLKEAARQYIMDMSPQEKLEFFKEIDPYKLWTMAEGAPETKIDVTQEPVRIDITHQLLKVYGPTDESSTPRLSEHSESLQLPEGPSK